MSQVAMFDAGAIEVDATDNDSLATPPEILDCVAAFWPDGYDLDPATNAGALTRPRLAGWTIADDCFTQPTWALAGRGTRIWMNPPYSNPGRFVRWMAWHCWERDCEGLALVKSDHSTTWWADAMETATHWCALRRRPVHYLRGARTDGGGKFASDLFYWGPRNMGSFESAFGELGWTLPAKMEPPTWGKD